MRTLTAFITAGVAAGAAAGALAAPAVAAAPKTVRGTRISTPAKALTRGTKVGTSHLTGVVSYVDATHGFAMAQADQAQYAVASTDGGRTWRIDSPPLHINAAQAPLSVSTLGVLSRRVIFAYGGAQAVDVSANGGRTWYRALFPGLSMAVAGNAAHHLVAFIDGADGGSDGIPSQYVTKDGGRTWRLSTVLGGG